MLRLKSVDSPKRSPFEGLEALALAQAPSQVQHGIPGDAAEPARASQFLVTGKRQAPLRRPGSVFESILGDVDRRKQILEVDLAPWRMISSLEIIAQNGLPFVGTGWFVGPRTVITAGHCVFDPIELGGWAKQITVKVGRSGGTNLGERVSKSFSTTDSWQQAQDPDFDYAAIHLSGEFSPNVGTFGVGVLNDADLAERLVNISGYPSDPDNGEHQYFHANRIKAVTARRIFYDIDTKGGQSGSPVWAYLDNDTTKPVVVGIHAYGVNATPASLGVNVNSGPRILTEVHDVIKGWMAKGIQT